MIMRFKNVIDCIRRMIMRLEDVIGDDAAGQETSGSVCLREQEKDLRRLEHGFLLQQRTDRWTW